MCVTAAFGPAVLVVVAGALWFAWDLYRPMQRLGGYSGIDRESNGEIPTPVTARFAKVLKSAQLYLGLDVSRLSARNRPDDEKRFAARHYRFRKQRIG